MNPPPPHTDAWCLQNPKRCKDNAPDAPIQSDIFTIILVAGILFYLLITKKFKL